MGKQYLLSTESKTYLSFFLGTQEIGGGGVGRCGGSGRKDLGSREALLTGKFLRVC